MTEIPNGESVEQIEDLEQTDVRGRLDKDPDEQRNREDMTDPDNRDVGSSGAGEADDGA